jgi:uncharacterized protein (DUF952 family)
MPSAADPDAPVFHLALRAEWRDAVERGDGYRRSTLGRSLDEEGFIHCSFAHQVQGVADFVFRGRDDVVLLTIDLSLVPSEVRVENLDGGPHLFPHIYGPLPIDAVVNVDEVRLDANDRLALAELLPPT